MEKLIYYYIDIIFKNYYNIKSFIINKMLYISTHRLKSRYLSLFLKENIGQMILDLDDEGITQQLLCSQIREFENVIAFKKLLQKNKFDLVLDIGSNIGFFVLLEGKTNASKILCFEPVSRNYKLLKINIILNDLEDKTIAQNLAIGKEDGTFEIFVPTKGNWSSFVAREKFKDCSKEQVNMLTLTTLYKKMDICLFNNILIRCDIEGYEFDLLEGNEDYFKKLENSWFVLEFHSHILKLDKSKCFIKLAYDIGFEIKYAVVHRPHFLTVLSGFFETLGLKIYELKIKNKVGVTYINSANDFIEKFLTGDFIESRTVHLYMYKK